MSETGCVKIPARTQSFFTGTPDCKFVEEVVPSAQIYYRKQGKFSENKPTIVFVHGLGETGEIWRAAQEELCRCYCTVAMDLRGFGRSSKTTPSPLPGGIHYTTDLYSEDIFELLKGLGIHSKIVLVGHSLGGTYAIKYASQHQDQLIKLVLVGAFPFITPDCAVDSNCAVACSNSATCENGFCYPFGITQTVLEILTQPLTSCLIEGNSDQTCLSIFGEFIAPLWYNEPCQSELQNAQQGLVSAIVSTPSAIISNFAANALRENITLALPGIATPTLICYGSIDIVVNPGNSQFIHETLPNSVLAEFVGKGHQLHITDYKNFDRLLKDFIQSCPMPDFIIVPDRGCCVSPLAIPINYAKHACQDSNHECK